MVSDRFRETYTLDRGVPPDRVHVLQNWGETNVVDVDARGAYALRQKYGILDHTSLVVYGGNVGAGAGVETAIKAFEYLWNDENICMLIAGAGSRLQACQELVETKGLQDRVFFYTPWPKKDTGIVLGAASLYCSQRRESSPWSRFLPNSSHTCCPPVRSWPWRSRTLTPPN